MPRFLRVPATNVLEATADVTLQPIALDGLRSVDLVVEGPDGSPSQYAEVVPFEGVDYRFVPGEHGAVRCDRRGRCRVVTPAKLSIAVFGAENYFFGEFDPEKLTQDDAGFHRLRLRPYLTLGGTVVGADGEPIAGASVSCGGVRSLGGAFPFQIFQWNSRNSRATTDARGRFELRFIPSADATFRFSARGVVAGRSVRSEYLDVSGESMRDIELVLVK